MNHLRKSQQRSSSDVFQAIEMKRSSDRLLNDVKEDMLDYMKVTHGNITAMWEFAAAILSKTTKFSKCITIGNLSRE